MCVGVFPAMWAVRYDDMWGFFTFVTQCGQNHNNLLPA